MVLDDFGENLSRETGPRSVRDPALAALLAGWAGKILITCETPFSLPEKLARADSCSVHVGPLTRSGGGELAPVPARVPVAHGAPAQPGVAADRRSPARHGVPGRAAGQRRSLRGCCGSDRRGRHGQATGPSPARTEPTELPEAAAEAVAAPPASGCSPN